jgi:ribosomal protein L11 methyltransferase
MTNTDKPYEQWRFETSDMRLQELLIASLDDAGFEGFEQREDALLAAGTVGKVDAVMAEAVAKANDIQVRQEIIQPQNWNAQWEADYQPVVVPGWCTVRAHFHPPATDTPHEVVVTPKMSFGTGHHATTWLMLEAMKRIDFRNKTVLDFGTGTGVLAILAAKLGASKVLAIDNDAWSVENACENVEMNSVAQAVEVVAGSLEVTPVKAYDIILANINRHVLLEYMEQMHGLLTHEGIALISGLLAEDEPVITEAAAAAGFMSELARHRAGWIALRLKA